MSLKMTAHGTGWARVSNWILDVSSTHREVLAITHGRTIDFLYRLGTGQPLHGGSQIFSGEPASLSRFEVRWPDVHLVSYSACLGAPREVPKRQCAEAP